MLWALFGNDDDGIYGPGWFNQGTLSWWTAVRWWLRNPFHNLFWHVINWPGGPFWKWGSTPGWNGYIGWRPTPSGDGVFGIAIRYERNP